MWRGRIAARGVPTGGSEQCPQPKIAVATVEREFPVQRNGSEYFVDIPYHFTVATQVSLGGEGQYGQYPEGPVCDSEIVPWDNGWGEATAQVERLLDVVSAGEVIYLLSYTDLVDGAGAFCDPDFCFIQPVTGQVALPAGFAAVDFPHTGYVIRTNPTHAPPRNRLEAFGNPRVGDHSDRSRLGT